MAWRRERTAEDIRGVLARLLRDEVTDPRVSMLSLTQIDLAPDLSTARVHWSVLATDTVDVDEVWDGLDSASGFLRRRLGQELRLRRTPLLVFEHDPSLEHGAHMLELIRSLNIQPEAAPEESPQETPDTTPDTASDAETESPECAPSSERAEGGALTEVSEEKDDGQET